MAIFYKQMGNLEHWKGHIKQLMMNDDDVD